MKDKSTLRQTQAINAMVLVIMPIGQGFDSVYRLLPFINCYALYFYETKN